MKKNIYESKCATCGKRMPYQERNICEQCGEETCDDCISTEVYDCICKSCEKQNEIELND